MNPRFDHAGRISRLQGMMRDTGVGAVLLSVGSDLLYFIGYEATPTERLTMLVVEDDGEPTLFVPQLEAPRVGPGFFQIRAWSETDDPIALVSDAVGGAGELAIGDHTWSTFLVGLQERLEGRSWSAASKVTSQLRMRKEKAEIEALRSAAHAVDRVMGRIPDEVRFSGRSELDVSRHLARLSLEEGHDASSFAIVASGPNGASPHHEPGGRVIESGDLVVCDFGGRMDGYFSDSTRNFVIGEPSDQQREVHAVVRASNAAGRVAVAPGVACQDIDREARQVIIDAGYGDYFIHRTGHGIGLEVHEHPYMVEGNDSLLEEGITFSVEPGIYLPDHFGVRIEDIVACGPGGVDDLNQSDRGLVEVE